MSALERAYTVVTGPQGAGKTSLVERIVASNRSRWLAAVRVREDAAVREPAVDAAGNEETRRWRASGTVDTQLLRVPVGWQGDIFDALEACDPMVLAAEAVIVEGDIRFRPKGLDAAVFVAAPAGPLAVEEEREVGRLDGREALRLMLGLPPEEADQDLPYGMNPGDVIDEDEEDFESEVLFEVPDDVAQAITRLLDEGKPLVQRKRWLRRGWEALPDADIVVVGVSGVGGRAAAESLRGEIEAVRRDDALRRALARSSWQWPRSCYVADLTDAREAGTLKAVQAIKRRWRNAFASNAAFFDEDDG